MGCLACAGDPAVVEVTALELNRANGEYLHDGIPFTGVAERHNQAGQRIERVELHEGRRHGARQRWYDDGSPWESATYRNGRRHGLVQQWWSTGTLRAEGHLVDGVAHGVQRQWYRSGALFKELNLDHGVEQGLQRAWRENGVLYANYEARDGRIYGLKRSKLCFQLDDEEVVRGEASDDRVAGDDRRGVRDRGDRTGG